MNVSHLEYFVAAVMEGSYSRAAQKRYVTTQAVSKAVKELEGEFGTSLMVREGRGVRPTPVGLLFFDQARLVLEECGRLRSIAALGRAAECPLGAVSIAVCTAESRGDLLPRACLGRIERANPGLVLEVHYGTSTWCRGLLRDGIVEVALCLGMTRPDEAMTCRHLVSVEPRFAVSPGSPLADRGGVTAADLNGAQVALPLNVDGLASLRHWLAAARSAVRFRSVGQGAEDVRAFLGSGGVVMVSGDHGSALPGVDHLDLPQVGDVRLRLPICACARAGMERGRFDGIYELLRAGMRAA